MNTNFFKYGKSYLIAVIILFCPFAAASAEETVIRLGYSDSEAFPYQIRADSTPPGIAFEIISEAARQTGIKIEYVRLPNRRVQNSLKEGEIIDGAFMFSYSEERRVNGVYPSVKGKPDSSRRIATLSYYIYKKKGNPLKWDGEKFSGVDIADIKNSIGANSGYSVTADLSRKGVHVDDGSKTTEQNFMKLQSGRIAGFAHQDLVADKYIQSSGISGIEKLQKPLAQKNYFLMFSHQYYNKNFKTAEKLWNKIGEIRDRKTSEILNRYIQ